jgi:hypothetical protein
VTVVVFDRTTSGLVDQVTGTPRLKALSPKSTHDEPCIVNAESSARLSAVRWTVAGVLDEQLARRARETGEFRFGRDDRLCELHCEVSDLTSSNEGCILKLVI